MDSGTVKPIPLLSPPRHGSACRKGERIKPQMHFNVWEPPLRPHSLCSATPQATQRTSRRTSKDLPEGASLHTAVQWVMQNFYITPWDEDKDGKSLYRPQPLQQCNYNTTYSEEVLSPYTIKQLSNTTVVHDDCMLYLNYSHLITTQATRRGTLQYVKMYSML